MTSTRKILVIGAGGQIGTELTESLRKKYGEEAVVASDVKDDEGKLGLYEKLDVLNSKDVETVIKKHNIKEVYLLAALLSATAEKHMKFGWQLNMEGLFNILDLAKEKVIDKVYWPSSIAVFGTSTPKNHTPQYTVMEPNTVYGISKQAGERWCEYYYNKFGVDVRSLRYPGLISYKSEPGGGTTDYAVHIYYEALRKGAYTSFLSENTALPMMYMPDAIRATMEIMEADPEKIKIRSSYNLSGMSFSPKEIALDIKKHIPDFKIEYNTDFRQSIADSWPASIDDSRARSDWGWRTEFNLEGMTVDMLKNIKKIINEAKPSQ